MKGTTTQNKLSTSYFIDARVDAEWNLDLTDLK